MNIDMKIQFTRNRILSLTFRLCLVFSLLFPATELLAQGVAINEDGSLPDNSSILDIASSRKGVLFPRMSGTERDLISSPAEGLIIYNTDDDCLQMYVSGSWQNVYCDIGCSVPPAAPGSITGLTSVSSNQTGVTYSIASVTDATSYSWTVPAGAVVVSGQGTTSITVDFGTNSGNVCVSAINSCGSSSQTCEAITVADYKSGDFEASSTQYLSINDGSQTGLDITGDMTMEAWFKLESLPGSGQYYVIASKSNIDIAPGADWAYSMWYDFDGSRRLIFNVRGSSTKDVVYNVTLNTGQWYHVAGVYKAGTSMELYLDGALVASSGTSIPSSINNTSRSFKIGTGSESGGSTYFDGLIDEVRVWNDARTYQEICSNLAIGSIAGSEANLVGYWTLDGVVTDGTSNGNDLTNNNSTPYSTDESTGSCTVPDYKSGDFEASSSNFLSINDGDQTGLDLTSDLTIECWVKFESLSGNIAFLSKWVSGGNLSYGFRYLSGSQELSFHNSSNGSTASWGTDVSYSFSTGTWYHVATVYDASAGSAEMFVNGLSVGTSTGLATSIYNGAGSVKVGATQSGTDENFDGLIDDMRVWNVKRTEAEICTNIAVGSITGSETNLVAYWTLDGILTDGTPNSNDLTNNNGTAFSTEEGTGSCTLPDYKSADIERDNSQYLSIADGSQTGLDLSSDFTLEAWVKLEADVPNNSAYFIMGKDGAGASNRGYYLSYNNNGGTHFLQSYFGNGSGGHTFDETNYTLPVGTWVHVAVVADISAKTFTYYIDGQSISTGTYIQQGSTTINNTNNAFSIGTITDGTNRYFDGLIDEVRVWSDQRTPNEICGNMAVGSVGGGASNLVGYWTLDGILTDQTSNGNDLTNNNSTAFSTEESSASCTPTKSIDLESSSSQRLSFTPTGLPTGNSARTVEAWVKFESLPTSQEMYVFDYGSESNNQEFGLSIVESSGNIYGILDRYGAATTGTVDFGLSTGTWYHFAVAYDGVSVVKWYLNGLLIDSKDIGGTLNTSTGTGNIGARIANGNIRFMDGLVDEVRVWSVERSELEICSNIAVGSVTGSETNLVGYWTLDGSYADETSNGNTLTNNNGAVFNTDEGSGSCTPPDYKSVDLESGSSQYLSIADGSQTGLDITGDLTIEARVKFESFPSNFDYAIVSKFDNSPNDRAYDFRYLDNGGTKLFQFNVSDDGSATDNLNFNYDLSTGVWYHVAVAWDASASTAYLYIDGVNVGSATQNNITSLYNSGADFRIGAQNTGGSPSKLLDGLVDEVRVWDDLRTATEICANIGIGSIGGGAPNLVGYWTLDGVLTDATSNSNDLSNNNSAAFSTDEGTGTCTPTKSIDLELDNDQSVYIADGDQTGLDLSASFTVEARVKFETLPSGIRYNVVGKSNPSGNQRGYGAGVYESGGNYYMVIYVYDNGSTPATSAVSNAISITAGTWYHMAFVKNGTSGLFYLDGQDQGSSGTLDATVYNNTAPFIIGAERLDGTEAFDGLLDDVRVWDVARSELDICNNVGIGDITGSETNLVGYWTLDGSYADGTSNGNNLSNSNGAVFSTDEGTGSCTPPDYKSIDLEASSSQKLSFSPTNLPSGNSSRTIEAWVKYESFPTSGKEMYVLDYGAESNNQEFGLGIKEVSGNMRFIMDRYNAANVGTVDLNLSTGTWYHLAVTYNGSSVSWYKDGSLVETQTVGSTLSTSLSSAYIGARIPSGGGILFMDGLVDDVRVWDIDRTEIEICSNLAIGSVTGSETNLVAYWTLDGIFTDDGPNSHTLTNNNSAVFNTDESTGSCTPPDYKSIDLEYDNSQYLSITDAEQTGLDFTGDLTFETWVKLESDKSCELLYKIGSSGQYAYEWELAYTPVQEIRFNISSNGTSTTQSSVPWDPSTGVWYHLAVAYDASAGSVEYYVDGVHIGTATGLPTSINNGAADFVIGSRNGGVNEIDGLMDDIRVWSVKRTASEICSNMAVGSVGGGASGLEGYWTLDGVLTDATSNNNDLTNNNSAAFSLDESTASCTPTKSIDLELSSNQYLTISDGNQTGLEPSGDFTIELWYKPESNPVDHSLVAKWDNANSSRSYLFQYYDDSGTNKLALGVCNGSSSAYPQVAYDLGTGSWKHLAVTYDAAAGQAEFFVDGSSVGTASGGVSSINNGSAVFDIGADHSGSGNSVKNYADGLIDDVRVWDVKRSSIDICSDLAIGSITGSESNLVGYWTLDGSLADGTANGNNLTNNNSAVFSTDESSGSCTPPPTKSADFEASSNQYMSIADGSQTGLDIAGDLTIEAWVKPESLSGDIFIVNKGDFGASTFSYSAWLDPNGKVALRVSDDGTNNSTHGILWQTNNGAVTTGTWQHVAVVFDISIENATCYVDGVLVPFNKDQGSTIGTSLYNSSDDFLVGVRENSGLGSYFDGLMDDLRVWSEARTYNDICSNMAIGSVSGSETNLEGYWTFDGVVTDGTSNGNDLTNNNSTPFSTEESSASCTPQAYKSGDLESSSSQYYGIEDYNQTGLDITGDLTIEAWTKFESTPSSGVYVIASKSSETGNKRGYQFLLHNLSGTLYLVFIQADGVGGTFNEARVPWTPATGQWYHLATTYDASEGTASFYVDGVGIGSAGGLGTSNPDNTAPFRIGARDDGSVSGFFDGLIDEVRVWDVVRTPSEICSNMAVGSVGGGAGNLQGYWTLDGVWSDATSNGNDLLNINTAPFSTDEGTGSCTPTKSVDLENGSSQSLQAADASSLDITSDITIEAWIKVEGFPETMSIVCKGDGYDNQGYNFMVADDGSVWAQHSDATGGGATLNSRTQAGDIVAGTWYHVAMTWLAGSNNPIRIFINGSEASYSTQQTGHTFIRNSSDPLWIGKREYNSGAQGYFDGLIDDVRIWDVSRTPLELCSNIAVGSITGSESNLQGYWTLDGTLADATANANNLSNNNSAVFSTDEGTGSCTPPDYKSGDFESGSSHYLSISDGSQTGLDITGDMSVEAWVKFESLPGSGGYYPFVAKMNQGSNQQSYFFGYRNDGGPSGLYWRSSSDGTNTNTEGHLQLWTPTLNQWYHVAAIYEASATKVTFYIDGIEVGSNTNQKASIYNSSVEFRIGSAEDLGSSARYMDGLLDEVRVWNDVRTGAEICSYMAVGSVGGGAANLVGYWTLDGVLTDETSNGNDVTNNNGTEFSTDESTGSCTPTKSIDLESSSQQYVYINDGSITGLDFTGDFTFEAWIKPETANHDGDIITKSKENAGGTCYRFNVRDTDKLFVQYSNGSGETQIQTDNAVITAGTWQHVAVSCDVSEKACQFFVNGSPVAATNILSNANSVHDLSVPFTIGAGQLASGAEKYFDGLIDDVRVWDKAKNETEICSDMAVGNITGSESNLVGYWTFDGTLGDASSNGNSLSNNNSAVFNTDESTGSCTPSSYKSVDLEANSNHHLYRPDADLNGLDLAGDMSIEAWVKWESTPSSGDGMVIVSKDEPSITANRQYLFKLENHSGTLDLELRLGFSGSSGSAIQAWTPTLGQWYHLAVTRNQSTGDVKFYVDGAQYGSTQTLSTASLQNTTAPFAIGANFSGSTGVNILDGKVDDVRVWDDVRTATEICSNMAIGSITGGESNLVGYYTLDGVSTDGSGNGNDLSQNNFPPYTTDESSGSCTPPDYKSGDFEVSSSQYLSITDGSQTGLDITGDLTIEFWARWESIQAVVGLVSKWDEFGTNNRSYQLRYKSDGGGDRFVFAVSQNGSNATEKEWFYTPTVNTWYHIAMVYDASAGTSELFINGISQGSQSGNYTSIYNGNSPVWVGSTKGGSGQYGYFDGLLDEVRIWNVAKSSSDICSDLAIGNITGSESGLKAYWKLDGDLTDATSNGNTLTNTNGVTFSIDESTGSCSPPPVFESISSVSVTGGHPLNIPKPSGLQVGDLMVAIIGAPNDFTTSSADGFTELYDFYVNEGNMCHMGVYWKIATAADVSATDFTFNTSTGQYINGCIMRISGANQSTPINASNSNANTTNTSNPTFNGITPSVGNCLMIVAVNHADQQRSVSGYTIPTNNPSWTERYDAQGLTGDTNRGFGMAVATAPRPQTTATGNWSCTYSGGELRQAGVIIAIAPQ